MRLATTLLTVTALVLHALLGCCWHAAQGTCEHARAVASSHSGEPCHAHQHAAAESHEAGTHAEPAESERHDDGPHGCHVASCHLARAGQPIEATPSLQLESLYGAISEPLLVATHLAIPGHDPDALRPPAAARLHLLHGVLLI